MDMYNFVIKIPSENNQIVNHAKRRINFLKTLTQLSVNKSVSSSVLSHQKSSRFLLDKEKLWNKISTTDNARYLNANDKDSQDSFDGMQFG